MYRLFWRSNPIMVMVITIDNSGSWYYACMLVKKVAWAAVNPVHRLLTVW